MYVCMYEITLAMRFRPHARFARAWSSAIKLFQSRFLPPVIQNRIALFADDSKCSSVIESLQDCESLQKELDSLHGWSDT